MCGEWNDMEVDYEAEDITLDCEIAEDIAEEDYEDNPLEDLELLEETEVSDVTETMMIGQKEYEWMLETHDIDIISNAMQEGMFEVIDDTLEEDSPKTLTRFPDVHFEECEECTEEGEYAEQEEMEVLAESEQLEEIIDYEDILRGIEEESLRQGFENIDIEADEERLSESLSDFQEENWENLSLEEQKAVMENLADYVKEIINLDNPPEIEYYNREKMGEYGGYNPETNILRINEYMLYNAEEAADTIAHELWHAHQHECAENPQSALDYQYLYNFENYIPSDMGQDAYESQLVEAEARAFAEQFKERIGGNR